MFGLTLEKLLLVGLIAAVVIGPQRLPAVVARLTSLLRALRGVVDAARHRAATELGVPADATEWRALDPRRYDPRRIIAEALAAPPVVIAADTASGAGSPATGPISSESTDAVDVGAGSGGPTAGPVDAGLTDGGLAVAAPANAGFAAAAPADATRQSVPMRRIRVGSSAHPRWIEVPDDASVVEATTDGASDAADTNSGTSSPGERQTTGGVLMHAAV